MFLKPWRPKNLRFNPAGKISFDLTKQKKQNLPLETKDSSSADHCLPNNKVSGRPVTTRQKLLYIQVFPGEVELIENQRFRQSVPYEIVVLPNPMENHLLRP
jgi:hypothetical protein